MDADALKTQIGAIITNLQSLELALRLFLSESVGPADANLQLDQLKAGDVVTECHLTNYDSLGPIIRKVNERLDELGVSERVDESLVEIRDALAHGRVFSLHPDGPYRLIKFSRPEDGQVEVAIVVELTSARLKQEVGRSNYELLKVVRLARDVGLKCFPED